MRLHHVSGDEMVFLYDHSQQPQPRVGDSYYVREVGGDEALVVQVVALETFDYPSLSEVLMRQLMEESYGAERVRTFAESSNAPQVDNLGQARAKIRRRRVSDGQWRIWNGWLPSRNVRITRVEDEELLHACGLYEPNHPLNLGTTLDGRDFAIAGRNFEKINVVTALKGMGKSHLAKVLIIELMRRGMASVVFDLNREYTRLPALELDDAGIVATPGAIVLSASKNFRVTIEGFGRSGFIRLFEHYSPTENTRNMFEMRVSQAFDQLDNLDDSNQRAPYGRTQPRPFFNLDYIRGLFPNPP